MVAKNFMTKAPVCCKPETGLVEVAQLMVSRHCGAIPVIGPDRKPIGVVTDRDIVCRIVAKGLNPTGKSAADCLSSPVVTVAENASVDDCSGLMEQNLIRRLIVVNEQGQISGIIAQADVAQVAPDWEIVQIERIVAEPTEDASRVVH